MRYRIKNKRGTYLCGFYSNGGFEIRDVFACSKHSWLSFETEQDVQNYILKLKDECMAQSDRWGKWLDKALIFIKTLTYETIY
jgi:hypothetical protein